MFTARVLPGFCQGSLKKTARVLPGGPSKTGKPWHARGLPGFYPGKHIYLFY